MASAIIPGKLLKGIYQKTIDAIHLRLFMPARFFLIIFLIACSAARAQTDSLRRIDPVNHSSSVLSLSADTTKKDSSKSTIKKQSLTWQQDTAFNKFFINKKFSKDKQSVFTINAVRQPSHEDGQFYMLIGLLLFTGIIRALFPKYVNTLLLSFFQSSQRQRYIMENASQDVLPSFLMNLVFIFSGGLLLAVFIREDDFFQYTPFPMVWLYAGSALAIVYIAKSFFITLLGWAFDAQEATSHYRLIVFMVNKLAGLCFIPMLLILLYSTGEGFKTASTVSLFIIAVLLLYRYIVSLSLVGKKLKIHPLYFFLYLCAVEILPLLITYKVLLITREL